MSTAVATDEPEWPLPPRNNPELVGHEEAEQVLLKAFYSGRMAHAWLISGRRGIGKATLAHRFARFVLSTGCSGGAGGGLLPISAEPSSLYLAPGEPVFHRCAAGGHADLICIERSLNDKGKLRSEIVVDDVREIGGFLNLTAAEGGWRVVIIDSADEMNQSAANAVLKVLEEPPAKTIMMLVSHAPGRLLATIRSRCRRLQLKPLTPDMVTGMIERCRPELSLDEVRELSQLSEGSIGRAISLADEGGVELYRDLLAVLDTLGKLDVSALHKLADRVGKNGAGETFRTVGELLTWWLGRLILFTAGSPVGDGAGEDRGLIERLAGSSVELDCWLEVWEKINRLLARTESSSLDRKQVFINAILALENTVG